MVISIDVLYHRGVENDIESLKEIYKVINDSGVLLLHLPAYNFLRSRHDEAVHTKQRYTKKDLENKVREAGFEIKKITYRNSILFPLAVIKRIIEKLSSFKPENVESELKPFPPLINKFFTYLLFLENKLITSGVNFPFGLSIYCIARKKK
jgi:hypothetical protein